MSFVQVNGGGVVGVAYPPYLTYNITANITLFWATQFTDSANLMAYIMDFTTTAGLTVTFPDAREQSEGATTFVNNVGPNNFNILNNTGGLITTVPTGSTVFIYLVTNTTQAGGWRVSSLPPGAISVTSVGAQSLTTSLTIASTTTNPITSAGTFQFSAAGDLASLIGLGTGIAVKTGALTWKTNFIEGTVNQINVANGDATGVGPVVISLPNTLTINSITAGNINITGNTISSVNTNGNIILSPNGTGVVQTTSNLELLTQGGLSKAIIFQATDAVHTISFQAGNMTTSQSFVWPVVPPVNGQILAYNSGNALIWATVPTFGGVSTPTAIARFFNTTGTLENSGVLLSDGNDITGVATISIADIQIGVESALTISTTTGSLILAPVGLNPVVVENGLNINSALPNPNSVLKLQDTGFGNYVGLKAPAGLGGNIDFSLPGAFPGADTQIMQGSTAGAWSFSALTATIATQVQQQAFTSAVNPVVPSNQQWHPSAAKAWVSFQANGTVNSSYNVTSVTKNGGNGSYTINFTNNFSATTYATLVSPVLTAAGFATSNTPNVNNVTILAYDGTFTLADTPCSVSIYGTLA